MRKYAVTTRGCKFYKFKSPAAPSVPDRILVTPRGHVLFLELKKPGEKPTLGQLKEILDLCELGADARWSDNFEEMKGWIDELCA